MQFQQESRMATQRKFVLITGASSGIGYYLAKECAEHGCDLLIAADEHEIEKAAEDLRAFGSEVTALNVDLAEMKESTSCWPPQRATRSIICWPMPAAGSAAP